MDEASPIKLFFRPLIIFIRIFPFVISFLRDHKKFLFFGEGRELTKSEHKRRAETLTETLSNLGPGFIKGAQVMATRDDILMPVYTRSLRKLQDSVPPFPTKKAHKIIQQATGKRTLDIFDEFHPEPIAAASLGQVHRGVYKGKEVAIKVLRPQVETIVEIDLRVLGLIISIFELFINNPFIRSFRSIYQEYARIIREEMDFRNEYKNSIKFAENLKNYSNVVIPHCYKELTYSKLVVFEYMKGCRVDDPKALKANGTTPEDILELMITTYVRMTIVHGFIHADPHPGNLLVDERGRLIILDFGMAVEFDDETRKTILRGCLAVVRDDINTLVDCFYDLEMVDESANRALIRDAANRLLKIQMRDDFEPRMVQEIADEILATFHEFPVRMPQQLVYLFRASALVEGLGIRFDPNFSAVREATPIVKKLIKEIALEPDKSIPDRLRDGANEVYNFVDQLRRVISRMEREEQRIRINAADMNRLERVQTGTAKRQILFLYSLFLGASGVAASFLLPGVLFKLLGIFLSVCITTFLFLVAVLLPIRR